MSRSSDQYADYVEHPRYGRGPRMTGLNPRPHDRDVQLHWNSVSHDELAAAWERVMGSRYPHGSFAPPPARSQRIACTAIRANLSRQTPATVPITHYFDLDRICRDCGRPFIFFAAEQKHWYEELGFGLDSDCVRCVDCRKQQQGIARLRATYEMLFHVEEKSIDEAFEMADACVALIEANVFTSKQTQRVRALLNAIPDDADIRKRSHYTTLIERVRAIEQKNTEGGT